MDEVQKWASAYCVACLVQKCWVTTVYTLTLKLFVFWNENNFSLFNSVESDTKQIMSTSISVRLSEYLGNAEFIHKVCRKNPENCENFIMWKYRKIFHCLALTSWGWRYWRCAKLRFGYELMIRWSQDEHFWCIRDFRQMGIYCACQAIWASVKSNRKRQGSA